MTFYLKIEFEVLGFKLVESRGYQTPDAAEHAADQLLPSFIDRGAHFVCFSRTTHRRGELSHIRSWHKPGIDHLR